MRLPSRKGVYAAALMSVGLYVYQGYFINREETIALLGSCGLLMALYWVLWKGAAYLKFSQLLVLAIVCRGVLLPAFPWLSDDIYRFVWDGRLLMAGLDPFAHLPSYYMESGHAVQGLTVDLFTKLNSPQYFTVYPPLAQCAFWLAVQFSPDSVWGSAVVLRVIILVAEIVTIVFIRKILILKNQPWQYVQLYALNPLIVLELTGNLHFEAVMIMFLVLTVYWLEKKQLIHSAIALALAVAAKLLPLIVLPFAMGKLNLRQWLIFNAVVGVVCLLIFTPFLSTALIEGMTSSVTLYFQKFEFNASIYYLLREIGYFFYGYNIIATAGKLLALITLSLIVMCAFRWRGSWATGMLLAFTIYLSFATTVHPWYISLPVALSCLTRWRFPLVWSGVAFLSYAGYTHKGYNEVYALTSVEYIVVALFAGYELYKYYIYKNQSTYEALESQD